MPAGQLEGVTVVDLSTVGPGARCAALLADLGADVVKVARPRAAGAVEPPWFSYGAGRGTRVARLDLKSDAGRDAFLGLTEDADVVVESYRPGVADRLGVGWDAVSARNPKVIYAALTGYGQDGPYAQWAGHDLNYLAVAGFLAMQEPAAEGGPALPGATVADSAGGGMHAAIAILAALVRRSVTGEGQRLDVAATEGVLSLMSLHIDEYLATGNEPAPRSTLLTGRYACYDVYRTADGKWLAVAAIEARFFANLCRALGCEHLAASQYDDTRQSEIRAVLAETFAQRSRDEWVAALAADDTCVAPVQSIAEVAGDPHLRVRGAFSCVEHPQHGEVEQVGPVIAGSGRQRDPYRAPPPEVQV